MLYKMHSCIESFKQRGKGLKGLEKNLSFLIKPFGPLGMYPIVLIVLESL